MRRGSRKRHVQLTLDRARKPDGRHGGWRPGSGRPKKAGSVSHAARPDDPARLPKHVTLRINAGVPSLARERFLKIIRAVVRASHMDDAGRSLAGGPRGRRRRGTQQSSVTTGAAASENAAADETRELAQAGGFRIVEFNVLGNHLHLIVEAANKLSLSRGIQGFSVSAARRLNSALMRKGKLFAHRYHARALKTPREVRNALAYVLLNRKHHDAEKAFSRYWIDPMSSAAWFTGWAQPVRGDEVWKRELLAHVRPTALAETWLLTTGWKRHGLLCFDERPGGASSRNRRTLGRIALRVRATNRAPRALRSPR